MRSTRTFVELAVPRAMWELVWSKLNDAGYDHAIDNEDGTLDMDGIALVVDREASEPKPAVDGDILDAVTEIERLRDLIDLIADTDLGEPEVELRTILDLCRQEQKRWQDGEEAP